MVRVKVRIEGTTPLICNRFTDEAAESASRGNGKATLLGDKGSPLEQATKKLYTDNEGNPMIPNPNLFRCLIDGGAFFKAGKSKITTQKSSMIPACMEIEELCITIINKEPWTVDTRPVRIPSTGGRILAHRPIFNDWALEFDLNVDTDMMPIKLAREILDASGKRIGLGDFRPACKGPYGKFVVTLWEIDKS
jgi:hypothetical protein